MDLSNSTLLSARRVPVRVALPYETVLVVHSVRAPLTNKPRRGSNRNLPLEAPVSDGGRGDRELALASGEITPCTVTATQFCPPCFAHSLAVEV